MRGCNQQRGALMITAVVLIVVIGFLGTVITKLYVGNQHASFDYNNSAQALFLSEAGLARGLREWTLNPATYVGEGPLALGTGDFSVVTDIYAFDGVTLLLPGQKKIRGIGNVTSIGGTVTRTTELIVQSGGTSGTNDPFPDITPWTGSGPNSLDFCPQKPIAPLLLIQGLVGHDATDDSPASTGGAFYAQTDVTSQARFTGYRERTLSTIMSAGSPVTLDFWYKKISNGSANPGLFDIAIDLVATDGTVYRQWADCSRQDIGWTAPATVAWTVPAGKVIDRVRIAYDIENGQAKLKGKGAGPAGPVSAYFDDFVINTTGTAILGWQEVIP